MVTCPTLHSDYFTYGDFIQKKYFPKLPKEITEDDRQKLHTFLNCMSDLTGIILLKKKAAVKNLWEYAGTGFIAKIERQRHCPTERVPTNSPYAIVTITSAYHTFNDYREGTKEKFEAVNDIWNKMTTCFVLDHNHRDGNEDDDSANDTQHHDSDNRSENSQEGDAEKSNKSSEEDDPDNGSKSSLEDDADKSSKCSQEDDADKSSKCSQEDDADKSSKCSQEDDADKSGKCSQEDDADKSSKCSQEGDSDKNSKCSQEDDADKSSKCSQEDDADKSSKCSQEDDADKSSKFSQEDDSDKSSKCSQEDDADKSSKCSQEDDADKSSKCSQEGDSDKSSKCSQEGDSDKSSKCSQEDDADKSSKCSQEGDSDKSSKCSQEGDSDKSSKCSQEDDADKSSKCSQEDDADKSSKCSQEGDSDKSSKCFQEGDSDKSSKCSQEDDADKSSKCSQEGDADKSSTSSEGDPMDHIDFTNQLIGDRLIETDKDLEFENDWCAFECVVDDPELIEKLENLVKKYQKLMAELYKKSQEQMYRDVNLVVIFGHPHQWAKRMSVGKTRDFASAPKRKILKEVRPNQVWCRYSYDNATCVGSSGSPIFIWGQPISGLGYWFGHPHNHSGNQIDKDEGVCIGKSTIGVEHIV
ncbi:cysteine-rich, acidic integral membrane protein-like [Biomphalaria glabrata]|uniref:Cysteine-rich, acidic integral membrane protein-like n=1 Tax=Biomphalaria glabrata TaxID=6526 RepID=A0A9W2YIT7_BIOGL|nr:cysteine-rich, acidic integral membrane protein-like [Biomphalaria glabrata]XP_013083191.2 cysteine-rich, acidic integral membrane protein-like [Biomphalaria glabrata]XP_055862598.1 cysteine-rich, acidic integral membrane protein-like [Biomphalaria glabrata]XP_055862599.1 cysteine-rich, acidic integral membrane protein-like [Biomphalaria glabrata]XP_055862600.1 cysteine-rich, acidic integral membrane protein-like [Biomphalaria glabrata]